MDKSPNFEIIVGTYEEYLLGYKLSPTYKGYEFIQSFATHAHSSSIRTVCSSGKYVASGGADDRVIIYDMINRKEHCMLNHHNATISCLQFTVGNTHIVCASTDGVMSIVRIGNWQLEKIWEKPHKGSAILDIAIHPTGKLALTLGTDCTLRTWNLVKGRQAYAINLSSKSTDARSLSFVKWGTCGEKFILGGGANIELWSIKTGGILNKYQYKSKVTDACWVNVTKLAVGHEDGKITILDVDSNEENSFVAHKMRVKSLKYLDNWIVSASSDGHIKIWIFDGETITEIGDCSTGCRCTSLTLVSPLELKKEKTEINKNSEEVKKDAEKSDDEQEDEEKVEIVSTNTSKTAFKNDKGCKVIVEMDEADEVPAKKRKESKKKKLKHIISKKSWEVENV